MSDIRYKSMEEVISSFVNDAIGSMNFESLDKDIRGSIKSVFDELDIKPAAEKAGQGVEALGKVVQEKARENAAARKSRKKPRFLKNAPGARSGKVLKLLGALGTAVFGVSTVLSIVSTFAFGSSSGFVAPLIFLALSIALFIHGNQTDGRARRFETYKRVIGERAFCQISELAGAIQKEKNFVVSDLEDMIKKKFFYNAHLDQMGTCLMLDEESYQQYLATQRAYEERARSSQSLRDDRDPELVKAIEEGDRYISAIRRANDLVPDVIITEKLNRLELTLRNIFNLLEKKPDQLPKLRKFMKYYMPTTLKLVQTYQELDAQTVVGENISKSKKEIEQTLDTINMAYEKLLDSFFEEEAFDVKSDISVLETMLAQEGLTGQQF